MTTERLALALYTVDFGRDITSCGVSATVADVANGFDVGYASTGEIPGQPTRLVVGTRHIDGTPTDKDFHLVVVC